MNTFNNKIIFITLIVFFTHNTFAQNWETKEWVDEFLDPTGKLFISTVCEGVMSNTATISSELQSIIQVDNDQILIGLLEYKNTPSSSLGYYFIKIKDDKGKVYEFTPVKSKGWRIQFTKDNQLRNYNQDYYKLRKLMETNNFLKFSIKDEYSSSYVFTLNLTNYTTAINNIDIHSIPVEYKMNGKLEKEIFARINKDIYAMELKYDGITCQIRLYLKDIERYIKNDTCYFLAQKTIKDMTMEVNNIASFMKNAEFKDTLETSCGYAVKFNDHILYIYKDESCAKLSKNNLEDICNIFK